MWSNFYQDASVSQGQTNGGDTVAAYTSGDTMNWTLSDADGRAVDLLMNKHTGVPDGNGDGDGAADGGSSKPFGAALHNPLEQRLQRVERLLKVLDYLPAVDPPNDLVNRTLKRLDGAATALPGQPQQQSADVRASI
jgi:hypothetical protein